MRPCHPGFEELPQSGDVGAMFGLVVAFPEQLRGTKSIRKDKLAVFACAESFSACVSNRGEI